MQGVEPIGRRSAHYRLWTSINCIISPLEHTGRQLAGAGAGLALSHVDAIGGAKHDARVALIGAGAGAWAGLIASAVHQARTGEKVRAGTKIGLVTGAVALIALPVLACYGAGGCGGSS